MLGVACASKVRAGAMEPQGEVAAAMLSFADAGSSLLMAGLRAQLGLSSLQHSAQLMCAAPLLCAGAREPMIGLIVWPVQA